MSSKIANCDCPCRRWALYEVEKAEEENKRMSDPYDLNDMSNRPDLQSGSPIIRKGGSMSDHEQHLAAIRRERELGARIDAALALLNGGHLGWCAGMGDSKEYNLCIYCRVRKALKPDKAFRRKATGVDATESGA